MKGGFFTGSSEDGSDMKRFRGVYVNPNNPNEWSNKPYPSQLKQIKAQEKRQRLYDKLIDYMNGRFSFNDVIQQIKDKKCKLPRSVRNLALEILDKNEDNDS